MLNKVLQFTAYFISALMGIAAAFWITSSLTEKSQSQQEVGQQTGNEELPPLPPLPPPLPSDETPPETKVQNLVEEVSERLISDDLDTLMSPYNYDVENRRDPFKEFRLDVRAEVTEEGVFVGPLRPLQRFELDMIVPVAIIWDVETPKAMFVDPTNEVHILGKDERIGKNNGFIAAIREGEVVVIETVKRKGQLSFKTSIMKIGSRRK